MSAPSLVRNVKSPVAAVLVIVIASAFAAVAVRGIFAIDRMWGCMQRGWFETPEPPPPPRVK